jgi:hypothetical protein
MDRRCRLRTLRSRPDIRRPRTESEHDLHLVRPAVPRTTKARQLAAASLDVARTHVVEYQSPVAQVPPRQCCFYRRLRHAQPVECSVDFLEVDRIQPERHAEGVGGRRLVKRARRGKLCGRIDQPRHTRSDAPCRTPPQRAHAATRARSPSLPLPEPACRLAKPPVASRCGLAI